MPPKTRALTEIIMLCTDTDLLRWEPRLAIDAAPAAQTLFDGRGWLNGRRLSLAADPAACDGAIAVIGDACFATRPIEHATSITIGPAALGVAATTPANGDVAFALRTFAAQRALVSSIVARLAGFSTPELRGAATLGTLHLIFANLAAASLDEHADWTVRAQLYERLFRRAMRAACLAAGEDVERQSLACAG